MYETTAVKLNRGPAKGTTYMLEGPPQDVVLVSVPKKSFAQPWDYSSYLAMAETHEYRRSLRKTRGGTIIYEWMGKRN